MMRSLLVSLMLILIPITINAQLGPCATQIGPLKPNLISFAQSSKQGAFVTTETFAADSCTVVEGEISAGTHRLLRFPTSTGNIGDTDLFIGDPYQCPALYEGGEFGTCHGHLHIRGYTAVRLWTTQGYNAWLSGRDLSQPISAPVNTNLLLSLESQGHLISSHKQGFCLLDTFRLKGTPEYERNEFGLRVSTSHFDHCFDNQGITVGWGDEYGALLDGQWLVIDTLAPGWYMLEVQANPEHLLPESSYTDNSSAAQIRL